jgi:hypothetical protein
MLWCNWIFIDTANTFSVRSESFMAFGKCMFMAAGSVRCTLVATGQIEPLILLGHVLRKILIFTHVCRSNVCVYVDHVFVSECSVC